MYLKTGNYLIIKLGFLILGFHPKVNVDASRQSHRDFVRLTRNRYIRASENTF